MDEKRFSEEDQGPSSANTKFCAGRKALPPNFQTLGNAPKIGQVLGVDIEKFPTKPALKEPKISAALFGTVNLP